MHMALDFASIGLRIKHARTKKDMTQDQLADALNTTRHHISLVETGDRGVSLELLIMISNTLKVPISELLRVEQRILHKSGTDSEMSAGIVTLFTAPASRVLGLDQN